MVIVIIQFQTNLDDVVDIPHLFLIEEMKESYKNLHRKVILILSQSNKSQYQWVLLLNLINNYVLTPSFSEFIVDKASRNGSEEEKIEENEDYKEDIIGLVILHGKYLVVRVEVVCSNSVYLVDHPS